MLSSKISKITPSFTIGISTKVNELKAQGEDIINLSIGEPDFPTPVNARIAAVIAINKNKTKYDAASGLKDLRNAIKNKLEVENQLSYDIDQIVVSSGAKHAITNTLIALTDHGDEVIIPAPYWVSYPEMVKLTGGTPVVVNTKKENGFKLTAEELKASITEKTKLLFITNPSNPTGSLYSKDELIEIVNVCIENNIYILADEIYEKIRYVDEFVSIASLSEKAKEITITINGLSKSAAMTGWRIGYTASNKEIAKAIASLQGHLVSHPSTISQYASVAALTECHHEMKTMVHQYEYRKNEAVKILDQISGLDYIKPEGAFYLFMDISSYKEKLQYEDSYSIAFCDMLLEKFKCAAVPGIAFGNDDFIRISYATDIESLKEGLNRLKSMIESL
ncbi:MAG: pyridoxal phosphate-dependent aminotransferase [Firmicutes bacterium]|jgi:aspartate aminotransferase|nr:pyridoxal phosphate-dependent aminotransferase [Bacillota bacterium]